MNPISIPIPWSAQLPRALIVLLGMTLFHLLAGDAFASYAFLGITGFALLARFSGSIQKRITRIELSLGAALCVLVYIFGGYAEAFQDPSAALLLSTVLLLVALSALNEALPRSRLFISPLPCLLFIAINRHLDEGFASQFEDPLRSWVVLLCAWELLSSLIYDKRVAPTITTTCAALTLAMIYYAETRAYALIAPVGIILALAYFVSKVRSHGSVRPKEDPQHYLFEKPHGLVAQDTRRAYLRLGLGASVVFIVLLGLMRSQRDRMPWIESLDGAPEPLLIEQRDTLDAFLTLIDPSRNPVQSAPRPPLLSLSGRPLFEPLDPSESPTEAESITPPKQRVIVRRIGNSPPSTSNKTAQGFNVDESWREPSRDSTLDRSPSLRISQQPVSTSLPSYTFEFTSDDSADSDDSRVEGPDFQASQSSNATRKRPDDVDNPLDTFLAEIAPIASDPTPTYSNEATESPPKKPKYTEPVRDVQSPVGFAASLDYAYNVDVVLETDPAFEIYLPPNESPDSFLRLRFNTLDQLNEQSFSRRPTAPQFEHTINTPGWNPAPPGFASPLDSTDSWTVVIGSDWKDELPLPGAFHSILVPNGASIVADEYQFALTRPESTGAIAYRLRGLHRSDTRIIESALQPVDLELLTELPPSKSDQAYLRRLASRLGGKDASSAEFAKNLRAYFKQNHPYAFTFQFNARDSHVLVSWLRSGSPGICGYYAGAFTLLARARGIPARVVVGALTREYDPQERKFTVRSRDAHAWAEYLNEANQWVEVDLTPLTSESPRFAKPDHSQPSYAASLKRALDRLNETERALALEAAAKSNELTPSPAEIALNPTGNEPTETVAPSPIDRLLSSLDEAGSESIPATPSLDSASPPDSNPEGLVAAALPNDSASTSTAPRKSEANPMLPLKESPAVAPGLGRSLEDPSDSDPLPRSFLKAPQLAKLLLILLAVGFAALQFFHFRNSLRSNPKPFRGQTSLERKPASKLLTRIEQRISESGPTPPATLVDLHERTLQLRYGPHYTPSELKALRQAFSQLSRN